MILRHALRDKVGGDGDGGEGASWRDTLPEDMRNNPSLLTTKDVPSLAKQFIDQQAHLGNSIRVPSADAGLEDRKAFHEKLIAKVPGLILRPDMTNAESMEAFHKMAGRPDTSEEYELVEGLTDNDYTKLLRVAAHKQGLNKTQFKELVAVFPTIAKELAKTSEKDAFDRKEAITKEWGAATEKNTAIAASVAEKTGAPPALMKAIADGNADVGTLKWLHSLAAAFGGEGKHFAGAQGTPAPMTPTEAVARIAEIRNNKAHPVWNKRDPLHAQAVLDWAELHRFVKPG